MLLLRVIAFVLSLGLLARAAPSLPAAPPKELWAVETDPAPEKDVPVDIRVDRQIYPPDNNLGQELPNDMKVFCRGCSVTGDIIFSVGNEGDGVDIYGSPTVKNAFVNQTNFDFTNTWLAVVLHDFKIHIELEIDLTPSNDSNKLDIHLLGEPLMLDTTIPGLQVGFDPQIHGWLNVSKPVSFTYGMDIVVPTGATILIDVLNSENTVAPGFNETTFTPTTFQSSTGDIELDIELSFRPEISIDMSVDLLVIPTIDLKAGAYVDLPKIDLHISQVQNVDDNCAPAAVGASPNDVFNNLTKLETTLGMDAVLTVLGTEFTIIDNNDWMAGKLPVGCFSYDPETKTLVAPGSVKVDAAHGDGQPRVSGTSSSIILGSVAALSALLFYL